MSTDRMDKREENLFRSTLFRRLFLSYVVLILLFLAGASAWYLISYSGNERDNRLKNARQMAENFATEADRTLLTARALCSAMDASESIRNLYQTILIEKSTPDSMQLYKVRSEITRIKASADSLEVYSIMLGFTGDRRLYASGSVIALDQAISAAPQNTRIEMTSVSELLGQTIPANITVNKPFLVYAEPYVSASYGPGKGIMMVLMEKGFTPPDAREKEAVLLEKNLDADQLSKVFAEAQAARDDGHVVNVTNMKKNKKFQRESLAKQGYTEFKDVFKEK